MNTHTITFYSADQYESALENYASILEKTNQQLSLWTNPYGLMIGILTFILAIIAIVVSVYIWKNSKEQKELHKEMIANNQQYLEQQASIFFESKKIELSKLISEVEKIKQIAPPESRDELQEKIDEYKKEKLNVNNSMNSSSVTYNLIQMRDMFCTHCGFNFKYRHVFESPLFNTSKSSLQLGLTGIHCSKCGGINYL